MKSGRISCFVSGNAIALVEGNDPIMIQNLVVATQKGVNNDERGLLDSLVRYVVIDKVIDIA